MSEFIEAVKKGDAGVVAAMLEKDPALATAAADATPPILLATYYGHAEVARLIASRHPGLSLPEACALGDLVRAREVIDADPGSINRLSPDGYPPLGLAIFFRHPDVARLLIERGADVSAAADNAQRVAPVHAAVAVRDHETMELLIARGADLDARQQEGYTALHAAAGHGDAKMVRLLLRAGADRSMKSDGGKTAADLAADNGFAELAGELQTERV